MKLRSKHNFVWTSLAQWSLLEIQKVSISRDIKDEDPLVHPDNPRSAAGYLLQLTLYKLNSDTWKWDWGINFLKLVNKSNNLS